MTEKSDYTVVFECPTGARYRTTFKSPEFFEAWLKDCQNEFPNTPIGVGLTDKASFELCLQASPAAFLRQAVKESTTPDGQFLNLESLNHELVALKLADIIPRN